MEAPKNTADLRRFLLEQMVKVASGEQDDKQAKAVCNYAQQVYNTVNLEMKFATAKRKAGDAPITAVEFNSGA